MLYVYENISNIPEGIRVEDGNHILDGAHLFADNFHAGKGRASLSYATFADLFRLKLLAMHGGWWFDADMVALTPPLAGGERGPFLTASTFEGQYGTCAINCAMFCHAGDSIMVSMSNEAEKIVADGEYKFGDTGPFLLQRTLRNRRLENLIAPFEEFCPFPWRQIHQAAFRTNRELFMNTARLAKHLVWERTRSDFKAAYVRSNTRCIHLHNEIWRRAGIEKDEKFHPLSLVGRLARRHGITNLY